MKTVGIVTVHEWDTEFEKFTKLVEIADLMPGPVGEQLQDVLRVNANDVVSRNFEGDADVAE